MAYSLLIPAQNRSLRGIGVVRAYGAVGTAKRTEFIRRGIGDVGVSAELAEEDVLVIAYLREGARAKNRQGDGGCERMVFNFIL